MINFRYTIYYKFTLFAYESQYKKISRKDGQARCEFFFRRFMIDGKFVDFYQIQNINWDQRFTLDVI